VFTVAADVTTKYSPGMRVRYTQTTVKYGIITAVSTFSGGNTTITIYGGTDYTTANAAISANSYSFSKAPQGFPLDPAKWTETLTDSSGRTQSSPTAGTWYNLGSLSLSIPIGCWNVSYSAGGEAFRNVAAAKDLYATLSTANNSESDSSFTSRYYAETILDIEINLTRSKVLNLAAKTTYFLNAKTGQSSLTSIAFNGNVTPTIVRAVCAYL